LIGNARDTKSCGGPKQINSRSLRRGVGKRVKLSPKKSDREVMRFDGRKGWAAFSRPNLIKISKGGLWKRCAAGGGKNLKKGMRENHNTAGQAHIKERPTEITRD